LASVCPCACARWGTPSPYSRAVVQAGGWDVTGVAAREDRRAQEAEEPVRRCAAQRALHASGPCGMAQVHRPMQPYEAPRFDLRPRNLEPVRAAFRCPLHSESNLAARPHHRDVSKNALQELPKCVCNMSSLMLLYAPPEAWPQCGRAERALLPQERGPQPAAGAS
jgi:hypothetical protein